MAAKPAAPPAAQAAPALPRERLACLVLEDPRPLHVFYDLDTPVTLAALASDGLAVASGAQYLTPELIPEFDLYLSFTGGPILQTLERCWGARRTAALYGCVDPEVHAPVADPPASLRCSLGYLGTYAADRQPGLERLLLEPARRRPAERFLVVGSLYPPDVRWPPNVAAHPHLDPDQHPAFYSANRLTLSVSRQAMRTSLACKRRNVIRISQGTWGLRL